MTDKDEKGRPQGCVIHHLNGNKTDNNIDNLQLLPIDIHNKLHWKYEKDNNINRFGGD